MRVNIGPGSFYKEGWCNVDIEPSVRKDLTGSILDLPIQSGTADQVMCSHVLEHVPLQDVPTALAECRRILARDGQLLVIGPDFTRIAADTPQEEQDWVIYGSKRWPGDFHQWACCEALVVRFLHDAGFQADTFALTDPYLAEWDVQGAEFPWQCAVLGWL